MYLTNKLHEMYLDWIDPDRPYELPEYLCFSMRHNSHLFTAYYEGRSVPKTACFSIYDDEWWHTSTKYAKISFLKPEYGFRPHIFTLHEWDRWYLNNEEKEEMMDFLNSKDGFYGCHSNWESLIHTYNHNHWWGHVGKNERLPNGRLKYPDYLPEDLPMPDYRLLPEKKKWF